MRLKGRAASGRSSSLDPGTWSSKGPGARQGQPGFLPKKKANLLPSNTQPGLLEGWILERKQENPLMETVSRPPRFPPNREAKRPVSMSFLLGESGAKLRVPPPPNKRPPIAGPGVRDAGGVLSSPSSGTRGALLWRSPGQGVGGHGGPQGHIGWGVGGTGAQAALLQMGYLKKNGDGSLLYSVVNTAGLDADGACLLPDPVPFADRPA